MPTRSGPPTAGGRWSLLTRTEPDPTLRAHATADLLLERYGVVTRGSVVAEEVPGGFASMYKVLTGFEDGGRCRRGYFVDTLGGAQFSTPDVVDRLRTHSDSIEGRHAAAPAVTLAASDPANPYGAALPWPQSMAGDDAPKHRPGRKAGAWCRSSTANWCCSSSAADGPSSPSPTTSASCAPPPNRLPPP
ncbi:hypothetical protein GS449_21180 [Rhodococcus hoagii]|nr:hypothetical protein [Prescottella equi]